MQVRAIDKKIVPGWPVIIPSITHTDCAAIPKSHPLRGLCDDIQHPAMLTAAVIHDQIAIVVIR